MTLTNAERQQNLRDRRKAAGLVKKAVWIRPEHEEPLKAIEGYFRHEGVKVIYPEVSPILVWHDAFIDKPPCAQDSSESDCVLVIRDCGPDTLESYAISKYREKGWGGVCDSDRKCFWLDQEDKGYRVVKWAYLPPIS